MWQNVALCTLSKSVSALLFPSLLLAFCLIEILFLQLFSVLYGIVKF